MVAVAVTGASGFIGSRLCRALEGRGMRVHRIPHEALLSPQHFRELRPSLREWAPEVMFHLAWDVAPGEWRNSSAQSELIQGTDDLIRELAEYGLRRTIGIGTCLEYAASDSRLREDAKLSFESQYVRDKHAMHDVLQTAAASTGGTHTWCRLFFAFGSGDRSARLVPSLVRQMHAGIEPVLLNPNDVFDLVHVDDVVSALLHQLPDDVPSVLNIGSGTPVTPREVLEVLMALHSGDDCAWWQPSRTHGGVGYVADTAELEATGWRPAVTLPRGLSEALEKYE